MGKKILLGLLAIFIIMQFFRIDKTNPPSDPAKDFLAISGASPEVGSLLKNACFDCHSNYTKYPWYTNIAPASWWIKGHINEGKEHLNFSEWGDYSKKKADHKLEECYEEVEERHMPLQSYTYLHPEAKLSDEQVQLLVDFFKEQRN